MLLKSKTTDAVKDRFLLVELIRVLAVSDYLGLRVYKLMVLTLEDHKLLLRI